MGGVSSHLPPTPTSQTFAHSLSRLPPHQIFIPSPPHQKSIPYAPSTKSTTKSQYAPNTKSQYAPATQPKTLLHKFSRKLFLFGVR